MTSGRWSSSNRRTQLPPGWQRQIVPRIRTRDGHRCTRCGDTTRLEVHHIGHRDNHDDDNLATLCHRCHNEETQREARDARPTGKRKPPPHPGLR